MSDVYKVVDYVLNSTSEKMDYQISLYDLANIYLKKTEEASSKKKEITELYSGMHNGRTISYSRASSSNAVWFNHFGFFDATIAVGENEKGFYVKGKCKSDLVKSAFYDFFNWHKENIWFCSDDEIKILIKGDPDSIYFYLNFCENEYIKIRDKDNDFKLRIFKDQVVNDIYGPNMKVLTMGREEEFAKKLLISIQELPPSLQKLIKGKNNQEEKGIVVINEEIVGDRDRTEEVTVIPDFKLEAEDLIYDYDFILNYGVKAQIILSDIVNDLLNVSESTSLTESDRLVNIISEIVNPKKKGAFKNSFNVRGLTKFKSDFERNNKSLNEDLKEYNKNAIKVINIFLPLIDKYIENCYLALNDKDKLNQNIVNMIESRIISLKKSVIAGQNSLGFLSKHVMTHRKTIEKNNDILTIFFPSVGIQALLYKSLADQKLSFKIENALQGLYYGFLKENTELVKENRKLIEESKIDIKNSLITDALSQLVGVINIGEGQELSDGSDSEKSKVFEYRSRFVNENLNNDEDKVKKLSM